MRIVHALLVASLALLGACDSSEADMGPLTSIIQSSTGKTWSVQNNGDSVLMENLNDSGSVNYYYVNPDSDSEGRREISLELNLSQARLNHLPGYSTVFSPIQNPIFYSPPAMTKVSVCTTWVKMDLKRS